MGSVLVVEDDEDLATLLTSIVEGKGHDVRIASNGLEALDEVSAHMPDLILLDVKMPIMSGHEFAARFRAQYGRSSHIVVMTAADSAAVRAQEIGADAWLAKPFDLREVARVLESFASSPSLSTAEG